MSMNTPNSVLVEEANESAKRMALRWIRSVFRQVSVQTLHQQWTVEHDDKNTMKLNITQQALDTCEHTCQRLGTFWCRRLRDAGQAQVAEWVNEVLEKKRFFEADNLVLGETPTTTAHGQSSEINILTSNEKPEVETIPLPEYGNRLMLTKLRRLGQRTNIGDGPPSLERVSRTLDELGQKGQTDWPLGWNMIEEAATNNVKRLHFETLRGRPRAVTLNTNYEVVPKSLVQQNDDAAIENKEVDAIMASRGRLTKLMERKRKAASEEQHAEMVERPTLMPPPSLQSLARAPSSFGNHERLSWNDSVLASLSPQERETLERNMIHHTPDEESSTEVHSSVWGALKDVGRFHMYCHNKDDVDLVEMSDNKRRREERKAKKQRLFPREPLKEDREMKRAVTKVVRTIDGSNERLWMELDIGECLLDVVDPVSGQNKLCAFSSLEVMLKDEDAASTSMH